MNNSARVGLGWDLHRLVAGRPLMLGGLEIPSDVGTEGHSDGDVLLHAITDALLGAAGQPDIGELFPPGDEQWRGAASRVFVSEALRRAHVAGLQLVNVDATVIAERPRLGPHKQQIRMAIAALVGLDPARVGIKAKSAEGLGPVGEGRAIEAQAVVLLAGNQDSGS